ncbi:MAG: YbcC family protein [Planctomycetota bacterium]
MSTIDSPITSPAVLDAVQRACATIAPTWPLDRWIAVNPFWHSRQDRIEQLAARLSTASGVRMTMPRSFYRQQWLQGAFDARHLSAACTLSDEATQTQNDRPNLDELIRMIGSDEEPSQQLPLWTDLADRQRSAKEPLPWSRTAVDQISQHLAAWFDEGQGDWQADHNSGLLGSWRTRLVEDRGVAFRHGRESFCTTLRRLPAEPLVLIETLAQQLGLQDEALEHYLTALLGTVRGWASWCAFENWENALEGREVAPENDPLVHLLAIRASWELLLREEHDLHALSTEWRMQTVALASQQQDRQRRERVNWLLQHAYELAYQERLGRAIAPRDPERTDAPRVQAVFCIDVRSERFRRALERTGGDQVDTRGFAGFFGLPIAHRAIGSHDVARPQLPGLLSPAVHSHEASDDAEQSARVAARRAGRLANDRVDARFRSAPTSAFTFVESLGLAYLPKLLHHGFGGGTAQRQDRPGLTSDEHSDMRPTWPTSGPGSSLAERTDLAQGVLKAMGLDRDFANIVLLAGHGSSTANNPQAAGLHCGACGGQTGENNARLLANLLNDKALRQSLAERGTEIPASTWFVAGLHDTTTDQLELFDVGLVPHERDADLRLLRDWLAFAGDGTRAERAPGLGLDKLANSPEPLLRSLQKRGQDWAQLRPEWGLADNAAFIVAPRQRTRGQNLEGRTFLHDYDWQRDDGFATLTLILTAPMVVTNWINLQYYASTVDHDNFGSGNKLLHNVVGGNRGVFEGNGGDLRIGLSQQSLHDGEKWRHRPQRLSVVVAAPRQAIDDILNQHEAPRSLVENGWLHLLRCDDDGTYEVRLRNGSWRRFDELVTETSPEDVAPEGGPTADPSTDAIENAFADQPASRPVSQPATQQQAHRKATPRAPKRRGDPSPAQLVLTLCSVALGVLLQGLWT